jgi:hypothetical protein
VLFSEARRKFGTFGSLNDYFKRPGNVQSEVSGRGGGGGFENGNAPMFEQEHMRGGGEEYGHTQNTEREFGPPCLNSHRN